MSDTSPYNRPQIYSKSLTSQLETPCPSCQRPVQGFSGCDASTVPAQQIWRLYPCGCRVDRFFASNFAREMSRRETGHSPMPVGGLSAHERTTMQKTLEDHLTSLYRKRDAASMAGQTSRVEALEKDILLRIQELCALVPGAHNAMPRLVLSRNVANWAAQNNMIVPPGDGQAVAAGHMISITVSEIRLKLAVDPDFQEMPAGTIAATAQQVYDQLEAYSKSGTPMHPRSVLIIAKLIPGAEKILALGNASESKPVDDPDPRKAFADKLSRRPKRRITKLRKSGEQQ